MAQMPGAEWRPLPENATQTKIRPTQVILHTAVDAPEPTRLERWFARVDVTVESHFWITLDGTIVQMMDTEVRADANRFANKRPDGTGAISIETEDEGDPLGVPWTEAQLEALKKVILWAHEEHGIPLELCSSHDSPGIGWHAMWGAPSEWTPAAAKTCPGRVRIQQIHTQLLPSLSKEKKMTYEEAEKAVTVLYRTLLGRDPDPAGLDYWAGLGLDRESLFWAFLEATAPELRQRTLRLDRLELAIERLEQKNSSVSVGVDDVIDELIYRLEE